MKPLCLCVSVVKDNPMPEFERSLQDIKEEVRTRTDIVEIIGQYTTLKKAGKGFTGLCPFHADKKPSF